MKNDEIADSKNEIKDYKLSKITGSIWKINEFKEMVHMLIPIFVQLIFNVLIAQINLIIINWYKNGSYSDLVSRATLAYGAFQFIPAFVAVGSIISCGKAVGKNKSDDLSRIVVTGIFVNLFISGILVLILNLFAQQMCSLVSPESEVTFDDKNWISNFYRLLNIQLIVSSIVQVLAAPLQTLKKSLHISIGAIISNIIDISFVSIILFVFNLNVMIVAISISIAVFFQLIYLLVLNFKYLNFKINKKKQLSWYYAKEMLIAAAPITCEMMMMCLATLVLSSCISNIHLDESYGKDTAVTIYRNLNSIVQYLSAFSASLGTVSSVFVSKKIGAGDVQGAYESALNCWKLGLYFLIILTIIFTVCSWPILKMFKTTDLITNTKIGYIYIFVTCFWQLFDVANLTLLRALWAVGDLVTPIFVSVFTMGIAYVIIPLVLVFGFHKIDMDCLTILLSCMIIDPLFRTICYITRWNKGWWIKKIKI